MNEPSGGPAIASTSSEPRHAADPAAASLSDRVRSLRLPEQVVAQPSWIPVAKWVAALAVIGGLSFAGYRVWQGRAQAPPPEPKAQLGTNEKVALESKGYIIPQHQILVSPKVSGMVQKLYIEEGQRVKKGEVLAELEAIDYRADMARANAVLAGSREKLLELENGSRPEEIQRAKAELSEAQENVTQLKSNWDRNKLLFEKRALPEQEFETARSLYQAGLQKVEGLRQTLALLTEGPRAEVIAAARAELAQAQADAEKTAWRLENTVIRAPVSGTILKKSAEEGNIVNPIAFNISASICEMADLSELEVELSIQERDISRVYKGQACEVRADAWPKRVYRGVVSRLMPIADRAKGAIPVRVKLDVPAAEEGVFLKPEMGAVVQFFNDPNAPTEQNDKGPAGDVAAGRKSAR